MKISEPKMDSEWKGDAQGTERIIIKNGIKKEIPVSLIWDQTISVTVGFGGTRLKFTESEGYWEVGQIGNQINITHIF